MKGTFLVGSATSCGIAAFAILFLASPATPQAVAGRTIDAGTGEPVDGVVVALLDTLDVTHGSVLSDSAGEFILAAPEPGMYRLWATRIGYQSVRTQPILVRDEETAQVHLRLAVSALELEPLVVVGRRRENLLERDLREFRERVDYYGRSNLGDQRIFTREDFEGRDALTVTDWVRQSSPARWSRFSNRCMPRVFLDGRLLAGDFRYELLYLSVERVEGMEFYTGFGPTNSRFVDPSSCGVVLIWTRPLQEDTESGAFEVKKVLGFVGGAAALLVVGFLLVS
jgi:hypothetical protein